MFLDLQSLTWASPFTSTPAASAPAAGDASLG